MLKDVKSSSVIPWHWLVHRLSHEWTMRISRVYCDPRICVLRLISWILELQLRVSMKSKKKCRVKRLPRSCSERGAAIWAMGYGCRVACKRLRITINIHNSCYSCFHGGPGTPLFPNKTSWGFYGVPPPKNLGTLSVFFPQLDRFGSPDWMMQWMGLCTGNSQTGKIHRYLPIQIMGFSCKSSPKTTHPLIHQGADFQVL